MAAEGSVEAALGLVLPTDACQYASRGLCMSTCAAWLAAWKAKVSTSPASFPAPRPSPASTLLPSPCLQAEAQDEVERLLRSSAA